ncbi:MAG: hypothetical protein SGBAC_012691 [Bacillariaceae sp.]
MVILICISYILGIVAAASCNFLVVSIPDPTNPREDLDWGIGFSNIDMPSEVASFFGQDGGCESLDTELGALNVSSNSAAKSFAIFHCLLSTIGVAFALVLTCKKRLIASRRDLIWLVMRIVMYISMWCAILSFFLQENETCDDYKCALGGPGFAQLVNVVFLLIINFVLFFTNPGKDRFIHSCFLSAEDARRRDTVMTPDANVTDDPTEYPADLGTPGLRPSTRLSSKT